MSNDSDGATVICARKTSEGKCGVEIELLKENLVVMRPEVPLLAAICPVCGGSNILKKVLSIQLVDDFFEGSVEDVEIEEDPMLPVSESIADKVANALKLVGYEGKKWKKPVSVIKEFVQTVPMYQQPEGLQQLLATWKIDAHHIPLIIQRVFGSTEMQPPINQFGIGQPMLPPLPQGMQFGGAGQGYPQ